MVLWEAIENEPFDWSVRQKLPHNNKQRYVTVATGLAEYEAKLIAAAPETAARCEIFRQALDRIALGNLEYDEPMSVSIAHDAIGKAKQ